MEKCLDNIKNVKKLKFEEDWAKLRPKNSWLRLSENFLFDLDTSSDDWNFWKKMLICFKKISSVKKLPISDDESFLESIFNLN